MTAGWRIWYSSGHVPAAGREVPFASQYGPGPADRLGIAVQLATLPWLGLVPDEVASAPAAAVARLAREETLALRHRR